MTPDCFATFGILSSIVVRHSGVTKTSDSHAIPFDKVTTLGFDRTVDFSFPPSL